MRYTKLIIFEFLCIFLSDKMHMIKAVINKELK